MADPYTGEIRMFAGNFAPMGWAFCNGQLLPIAENGVLFQLIQTTYGGDGQETFALPDLRGRLPLHQTTGFGMGQIGGVEQVTLTVNQIPSHNHAALASLNNATASTVSGNVTGVVGATQIYREVNPATAMSASSMTPTGGSQPHTNMQPYLCINFIIALYGPFPSPN
jgi:microcystin-dependent protein